MYNRKEDDFKQQAGSGQPRIEGSERKTGGPHPETDFIVCKRRKEYECITQKGYVNMLNAK